MQQSKHMAEFRANGSRMLHVDDVVRCLGAKKSGGGWVARCPAHDDHDPSLKIDVSADGTVLLCCHAHCEQQAVFDAVRNLVGDGVTRTTPRAVPSATPAREGPPTVQPGEVHAAWSRIREVDSSAASAWMTDERGMHREVVQNVSRKFGVFNGESLERFPRGLHGWLRGRLEQHGPGIVAPLASPKTGRIENLHVRPFAPAADGTNNRFTMWGVKLRDDDGAPRAYGQATEIRRFYSVLVTEGLMDTLVGEALLYGLPCWACVGAVSVGEIGNIADLLTHRRTLTSVVFVPHLDTPKGGDKGQLSAHGIGQARARQAAGVLLEHKLPSAVFFWASFLEDLERIGVTDAKESVRDLADAVSAASRAGVSWSRLKATFAGALLRTLEGAGAA